MDWVSANGFLLGWVDTSVPGYRVVKKTTGGAVYTVPSGYYRWPDYITALDGVMGGGDAVAWSVASGQVTITMSGGSTVEWVDRLGWLCGMGDLEPGTVNLSATNHQSITPSPAAIPLYGASWSEVDIARERGLVLSRFSRAHSYAYGRARVWKWDLKMSADSLKALNTGWCATGKVTIVSGTPGSFSSGQWSSSVPGGWLDCYVLGVADVDWLDAARTVAQVQLITAGVI